MMNYKLVSEDYDPFNIVYLSHPQPNNLVSTNENTNFNSVVSLDTDGLPLSLKKDLAFPTPLTEFEQRLSTNEGLQVRFLIIMQNFQQATVEGQKGCGRIILELKPLQYYEPELGVPRPRSMYAYGS